MEKSKEEILNQFPRYGSTYEGVTSYTVNRDDALKAMEEYRSQPTEQQKEPEPSEQYIKVTLTESENNDAEVLIVNEYEYIRKDKATELVAKFAEKREKRIAELEAQLKEVYQLLKRPDVEISSVLTVLRKALEPSPGIEMNFSVVDEGLEQSSRFHPNRKSKCISHIYFPQEMWDSLPDRVKNYICDIEQTCDQTGNIQMIGSLTEQRDALVEKVRELESQLNYVRESPEQPEQKELERFRMLKYGVQQQSEAQQQERIVKLKKSLESFLGHNIPDWQRRIVVEALNF